MVWIGSVNEAHCLAENPAWSLLTPREARRVQALVVALDRAQSLTACAVMKLMIAAASGQPVGTVALAKGRFGKPRPATPCGWHVSASHGDGIVAVVLSCVPVGVDVERCVWRDDLADVARIAFSTPVAEEIAAAEQPERTKLFFRHWCLGEAYIKTTGLGLNHDLQKIRFSSSGEPYLQECEARFGPIARWRFGLWGMGEGT
jgi:4'-phosphopantetheinyl transferase